MACSREGWGCDGADFNDDEELQGWMIEMVTERMADRSNDGPGLTIEEAFADGGCARRIESRRQVRYRLGPRGRGRLPWGCPPCSAT